MNILAVDTTASAASCAIISDKKLIGEAFVNVKLTHSQTLMPMVESMLSCSKTSISDIDVFAVAAGPGSFTGVRIGVSAIKGMALVNNKPCACVSTLHALALNLSDCENSIVVPVMDARCSQVYNAIFEIKGMSPVRICEDRAVAITDVAAELKKYSEKNIFLVGDGAEMCYNYMKSDFPTICIASPQMCFQHASSVALAACDLISGNHLVNADKLRPIYLRPPQAERNRRAGAV